MSLCIFDQNNTSAAVNGTATVSIKDAQSALLYQNTIAFVESDFQNVSTPNGGELTKSWQVGYGEMDSSASKGGDLVCSIAVATGEWNLAAANDSVSLPSVLSIFKLYYIEASPSDQRWLIAGDEIQAGVTYEPYTEDIVQKGSGKVLLRSSDAWPDHPSYVLIMDKYWAQANPDLAARVIRAHMDAELWINQSLSNPGSNDYNYLIDRAANITGFSTKVVTEALTYINYSSAITSQTKSYLASYTDAYLMEGLLTNEMMTNHSYATSADFASNFTNLTYMEMAQQVAPSSTIVGKISLGWASKNIFMLLAFIAMDTSIWGGQTAFEKYGVQATSPEPNGYNTSALAVRDLIVGNLSVAYTAVCPAILTHVQYNLRTVMVSQVAAERTALVVARNINGIQDLQGKIVATPSIVTIQHIFLYDLAQKNGFMVEEIQNTSNTTI